MDIQGETMEFMILFVDPKGAPAGEPAGMAEMQNLAGDLSRRGKLPRSAPLVPEAEGARVQKRSGRTLVSDGPFAEAKEVVGGFWIVEAAGRDEAVALARRAYELGEPRAEARHGLIEVHRVLEREVVADAGKGKPFLLLYHMEPGLSDPDGSKMREMMAWGDDAKRAGAFVEGAPLGEEPAPARILARGGKTLVIDGPFAEAKEVIGGYDILRVETRAEAIEWAKRCPHAKWGPIEVREMLSCEAV
jgi:hypothetical protein